MTYLMSHVTCLNNICGWTYELSCNKLYQVTNQFVAKFCFTFNHSEQKYEILFKKLVGFSEVQNID
jgi:hypothetical protein